MTYRQYLKALDKVRAEARTKLGQFLGVENAEKLVAEDLEASLVTLKVFDRRSGARLYSRVVELGRTAADWAPAAADEIASAIAEHVSAVAKAVDSGMVKMTIPKAFRVVVYGQNRRYEVKSGRAKYAPIKRKKKG